MTSLIDLIGLAASIKELAPLFLKETNPAEIYTRLIGEQIRNRCGPSAVFDEDVFKTRLKQKSIDLLQLPITGDELTHSIGSTVSNILLDNAVVYGVDINSYRAQSIIRDAHAQYAIELFKALPQEGMLLLLQSIVRLIQENPQLENVETTLRTLDSRVQQSVIAAQVNQEHIRAEIMRQSELLEQFIGRGDAQLEFALSKPSPETPPLPPAVYAERRQLTEKYCEQLHRDYWLAFYGGQARGKRRTQERLPNPVTANIFAGFP